MADRLETLLEPTIAGLGYELLGIERSRTGSGQLLRLYIDQAAGITVEDCERVSRQVNDVIEAEQAIRSEFTLEVSSPGIDRPLFTIEQHRRFIGEQVAVRLRTLVDGRRRIQGVLSEVSDTELVIDSADERLRVPFREVERSKLVPDWSAPNNRGRRSPRIDTV